MPSKRKPQTLAEFNANLKDEHGNLVFPPSPSETSDMTTSQVKSVVTSALNKTATEYYSTDERLATAADLWKNVIEPDGNTIWIADIEVIDTFKALNRLPKLNKAYALPHPVNKSLLITNKQFAEEGNFSEEVLNDGTLLKTWELRDIGGHVMRLQKNI